MLDENVTNKSVILQQKVIHVTVGNKFITLVIFEIVKELSFREFCVASNI